MRFSHLGERAVPLALAALAASAWIRTQGLPIWTIDGPGSGLLPKAALGIMLALSLILVLKPSERSDKAPAEEGRNLTFLVYSAAAVAMAVAVHFLGFVVPAFLVATAILRFAENRSWLRSLCYSAALIAVIVLLFGTALSVQFPDGPAERLLNSIGLL
jgi:Tripartite tricarboxylate transporter TctB family